MNDIRRSDSWINKWVISWVDMICGLVGIVTFCYYRPWWDYSIRSWCAKSYFESLGLRREGSNENP